MFNLSNQEKVAVIFLLVIIIIALGTTLFKNLNGEEEFMINPELNPSTNNAPTVPTITAEVPPVIIHISGAVKNPGVYQLKSTDRVIDAVKMAGGAAEKANLDAVNLAALLKDGQKIIIPYRILKDEEESSGENLPEDIKNINSLYTSSSSDKININTAEASLLQSLPGIGQVLSERIVEYRDKNGFFNSIEEIKEVSGIGEKKFEGIKDLICVQ